MGCGGGGGGKLSVAQLQRLTCSAVLTSVLGCLVRIQQFATAVEHEGVHRVPAVHGCHPHLLCVHLWLLLDDVQHAAVDASGHRLDPDWLQQLESKV